MAPGFVMKLGAAASNSGINGTDILNGNNTCFNNNPVYTNINRPRERYAHLHCLNTGADEPSIQELGNLMESLDVRNPDGAKLNPINKELKLQVKEQVGVERDKEDGPLETRLNLNPLDESGEVQQPIKVVNYPCDTEKNASDAYFEEHRWGEGGLAGEKDLLVNMVKMVPSKTKPSGDDSKECKECEILKSQLRASSERYEQLQLSEQTTLKLNEALRLQMGKLCSKNEQLSQKNQELSKKNRELQVKCSKMEQFIRNAQSENKKRQVDERECREREETLQTENVRLIGEKDELLQRLKVERQNYAKQLELLQESQDQLIKHLQDNEMIKKLRNEESKKKPQNQEEDAKDCTTKIDRKAY